MKHAATIITSKETSDYRIVTDDADNWRLVANRSIGRGELVALAGTDFEVDVRGVKFVDVILDPTKERRRVHSISHGVPIDASCDPAALELPCCFMNHSCEPNTQDRWGTEAPTELKFAETAATRDIAEGEELTYDYALEHYRYAAQFKCQCGVESCRGTIGGFDMLSREEQKQMLLRASPYVQEKYQRESLSWSKST